MAPRVFGPTVDDQTRCIHYRTPVDVIAVKFHCCRRYYACHACHAESESHAATQWPRAEYTTFAVLCGVCQRELTITDYLGTVSCPHCAADFNERCSLHAHLYFEPE